MIKSYFYLYRLLLENKDELTGSSVAEIYTQEKDKLFLAIPNDELPFRHLIIDANPNSASLLIKKEHRKARKNFKDFVSDYLPSQINKVLICKNDRVIKFELENFEIYFSVMGAKSNIYFLSTNELVSFRKVKIENPRNFLLSKTYVTVAPRFTFPQNTPAKIDELKTAFPFLNKFILNEYSSRTFYDENNIDLNLLEKICNEILTGEITIGLNETDYSVKLFPTGWKIFNDYRTLETKSKLNEALLSYFANFYRYQKEKKLKKELLSLLDRELEKLSNKLNELQHRIEKGSNEELYRKYANLLSLNRQSLFKGMKEIALTDFTTGEEVQIPLNEKLSPQQNIEKYYSKARDEKVNFAKSEELFNESKEKYSQLFELRQRLNDISDLKELELIKSKLLKGKLKTGEQNKIKFRHFLIDGKYHLFVGRDSRDNDELTFRFAKQNDYWFHARGYAGSHTVLRNANPKEKIPKNILKVAASVAAFYSKGKTAGLVPVSYTFRKFVRKKKGMEPGKVLLQKEDTLIVKPEIPTNCEQIFE